MNTRKKKEAAKKRLECLLSSKSGEKSESEKIKWDVNKEYMLAFHDKSISESEIILNSDIFQGLEENDVIELSFVGNPEIKLIFKIKKNNLDKTKNNVSIISMYNDLIKVCFEYLNKSNVFVRMANTNDYYLDKVTIVFKEQFISRKDIFQITQSLIGSVVYLNKEIKLLPNPDNDEIVLGNVSSLKLSKMKSQLTGIVTSNTDFQLRTIATGLYFLIEVSKDSYDFSVTLRTKFEIVIDFMKSVLIRLRDDYCNHMIYIIFFTRIYFNKKDFFKELDRQKYEFIYESVFYPHECFFDIYSIVLKMNVSRIEPTEVAHMLRRTFMAYASIFSVKNLNEYLTSLKQNIQFDVNITQGNLNTNTNTNTNTHPSFKNIHHMYTAKYFEDVQSFRMTKSNTSNLFEAVNLLANDLKMEKKKLYKLGNQINVVTSGEYFPYYNYSLSKMARENLYEQGIPFTMVICAQKSKGMEMYNCNSNEEIRKTATERGFYYENDRSPRIGLNEKDSVLSLRTGPLIDDDRNKGSSEENIEFALVENTLSASIKKSVSGGIPENLNTINSFNLLNTSDWKYRKESYDFLKDDKNEYKYEFDVMSNRIPKWIKVFFISDSSITSFLVDYSQSHQVAVNSFVGNSMGITCSPILKYRIQKKEEKPEKNLESDNMKGLSDMKEMKEIKIFTREVNCQDLKEIKDFTLNEVSFQTKKRKLSNLFIEGGTTNLHHIPEVIDNEIFNCKTKQFAEECFIFRNSAVDAEYSDLIVNDRKNTVSTKDIINRMRQISTHSRRSRMPNKRITLDNVSEIFNIYKAYCPMNHSRKPSDQLIASGACQNNMGYDSSYIIQESEERLKEMIKKANEYDHDVFTVRRVSRKNSVNSKKHEQKEQIIPMDNIISSRNLVDSYEFSETEDLLQFIELLKEIPMLPIFGELEINERTEEMRPQLYSISSLSNDLNILEEMIYERLNSNYQILKVKSSTEGNFEKMDFKKLSSIKLFDRRLYHIIDVEDQNYKVTILNYSNKNNKYTGTSRSLSKKTDHTKIKVIDYHFFTYDLKVKLFFKKYIQTKLNEKNEIFWQNFDCKLIDLHKNLNCLNFKNEINYIIIDKIDEKNKKKKKQILTKLKASSDKSELVLIDHPYKIIPKDKFNPNDLVNYTTKQSTGMSSYGGDNKFSATRSSNATDGGGNLEISLSFSNESEDAPYRERIKVFIESIDGYFNKYHKGVNSLSSNISFLNPCEFFKLPYCTKKIAHSLIYTKQFLDWVLISSSKYLNEKNCLFFSIKWLSCNSIPIFNLIKELGRKAKSKDLGIIKIPPDEVVYSNFKRMNVWYVNPSQIFIIDLCLQGLCLSSFIRSETDNNVIYFHEEHNILAKIIPLKGTLLVYDEVLENLDPGSNCNFFLEYVTNINTMIDLMNFLHEKMDNFQFE